MRATTAEAKVSAAPEEHDPARLEFVRNFGQDPIAYSTLQSGMRYFDTPRGFIAYRRVGGVDIVLGPPICAPANRRELLESFLAQARKPIFCYVREDVVRDLADSHLFCAGMGVDKFVDYAAFFANPTKEVRGAVKKADKAGFALRAVHDEDFGEANQAVLRNITGRFLENSQCDIEMSFINRPMTYSGDGLRRTFFLMSESDGVRTPFGYIVLNPIFDGSDVQGYLLDIVRFRPTRLWGVWLSTVWHVARLLESEGKFLSLGFSPLYGVRSSPVRSSRSLDWQVNAMVRLLGKSQYTRRLHELKSLIPGRTEARFMASHTRFAPAIFHALVRASGVPMSYLFGPDLLRTMSAGLFGGRA